MATKDTLDEAAKMVDEKIDATREAVGAQARGMRDKMSDAAENVRAKAASLRDKIRETDWDDVTDNVTSYVRTNPGKSVAIALGLGFALGLLMRRRSDD